MNANLLGNLALHQIDTRFPSASAAAKDNSPAAQKLRKAASEFESLLLANWWSTMKQSGLSRGEEDSDPGKDTLDHLGIQAMCAAVANGGGFGIGAMLVRSLLPHVESPKSVPAPPVAHISASPAAAKPTSGEA